MQTIINAIKSITNSDFMSSENAWFNQADAKDSAMMTYFKTEYKTQWPYAYQYYKSTGDMPKGKDW